MYVYIQILRHTDSGIGMGIVYVMLFGQKLYKTTTSYAMTVHCLTLHCIALYTCVCLE